MIPLINPDLHNPQGNLCTRNVLTYVKGEVEEEEEEEEKEEQEQKEKKEEKEEEEEVFF